MLSEVMSVSSNRVETEVTVMLGSSWNKTVWQWRLEQYGSELSSTVQVIVAGECSCVVMDLEMLALVLLSLLKHNRTLQLRPPMRPVELVSLVWYEIRILLKVHVIVVYSQYVCTH